MALTDEQIDSLFSEWLYIAPGRTYEEHRPVARAIESAACADRDARIAELERELAEARKDAELYQFIACACEVFHNGHEIGGKDELIAAMQKGQP